MAITNCPVVIRYRKRAKGNVLRSIRAMCIECMGGSPKFVDECTENDCPLYDFRMGKNPYHWKNKNPKTT